MKNKIIYLSGIIGSIICILSYFIFSSLNSEYYHITKAFSELGSVGQPNTLLYSFFGFIIPGIFIIIFCLNLTKQVNNGNVKKHPFILIMLSAILMSLGGFPMNYNEFSSTTSIFHIFSVMSSGLVFIIGAFTISKQLKKDKNWKTLIRPLLILVWILIVSGFFRTSEFPGLAQKIGILAYYIYISLLSWNAYKLYKKEKAVANKV
ncbi:MAG: hypothetical protein COA50_16750 [Flavobacteriaceae bacterium]|nr:MAG: hypothetical protein COA50_16750 [Flavobacteriaceae bacterium]